MPSKSSPSVGAEPVHRRDKPRERALAILCEAEGGAFAGPLLDEMRRSFGGRDSAFILELVYGVLRNRSLLDWMLEQFSAQPLDSTDVRTRNLLRMGAYQILLLDKVPARAAVGTSTELAKRHGRKPGYVNGLLRNVIRNRDALRPPATVDPVHSLSILHSHPAWLVRRWVDRFGAGPTAQVLQDNNRPARLMVRCNVLRTTTRDLLASLIAGGAEVQGARYSPVAIEVLSSPGIRDLAAYRDGMFLVQDEAAQLIGFLLSPRPGETVLDACAAPGGKATHLAELMGNRGTIVALDNDPVRIPRIVENSERLGATIIRPVQGDAAAFREGPYDKVLVDAPCSGLGVLRRHPDGRWTKPESIVGDHAAVQQRILENCAKLVRPGGVLVYATCTTEPEENDNVVGRFRDSSSGEFIIEDPRPYLPGPARELVDDQGFFRTFPGHPDMDGFYAVRMMRKA
jgi:16S rRNA (cytosine967-C5)-methyltransferase